MNILVTGSTGLVGSHFVEYVRSKTTSCNLLCPTVEEFDITKPQVVKDYFGKFQPKILVHFAAFTDINAAEQERGNKQGLAWAINVEGTRNIVNACIANKSYLLHISTDSVFSGRKENPGPYDEETPMEANSKSLSWYGWTKAKAESFVFEALPSAAIIRIANPVRSGFESKLDYVRKIIYLFDKGKLYPMFDDQYLTLTFINEVSEVISKLIIEPKRGIYHVSSADLFTPYDLAQYLLERVQKAIGVVRSASIEDFLRRTGCTARYPQYGGLKTRKTQKKLGVKFLTWQAIIDSLVEEGLIVTRF